MAFDKTSIIQNAQKYTIKGQIDKAIEEWQKIVKESPNDGNTFNTIGDLYLKKNNNQEAISSYLKAAKAFDNAGFSLKTIAVYKKIIKIDTENVEIQIKMADLDAERGLIGNAIEEYIKVVRHYSKKGYHKEAIAIYKKIINLDSNNIQMRLMLASLFEKEGEKKEAVDQYVQIANIFRNQNKNLEAEDILKRVLILEPAHPQAEELLKDIQSSHLSQSSPEASIAPEIPFENIETGAVSFQEFSMTDEVSVVKKGEVKPVVTYETDQTGPAPIAEIFKEKIEGSELKEIEKESPGLEISKLVSEAEGMLREKLFPSAIETIRKILELDPANPEAQQLLLRAHGIKETEPSEGEFSAPTGTSEDSLLNPAEDDPLGTIDLSAFDASLTPSPSPESVENMESSSPVGMDEEKVKEKLAEGEFYTQQGLLSEAKIIYETILRFSPGNSLAQLKLAEIQKELADSSPQVATSFDSVFSETSENHEEAPKSIVEETPRLENAEPVQSVNKNAFTPGTLKLKTTVLDQTETTDFVNLMGELEKEFIEEIVAPSDDSVQDDDFGKIIKEFQKGIQANIGDKDFETHFDLGVAYKEMGLRTEAIGEFQIAIKGGARAVDSAILLSQCYLEDGLPKLAVEQLSQTIQVKQLNPDQIHSLKYELGSIYETQENYEEALNVFSDIYKENVNYRDVPKKISQIRQKAHRKA